MVKYMLLLKPAPLLMSETGSFLVVDKVFAAQDSVFVLHCASPFAVWLTL